MMLQYHYVPVRTVGTCDTPNKQQRKIESSHKTARRKNQEGVEEVK